MSSAAGPIADDHQAGAGRLRPPSVADPQAGRLRQLPQRLIDWWETPGAFDLAICLVYAAFAFWITNGLWPDPATRAIADNVPDQALIEWFLAHGVLVWRGDFAFVTDRLNVPDGVNLMSNASHILHGVLMAPVTALFGVAVSFALLVALNLAATAAGWYLLLARTLKLRRGAAFLGGAFAGFAPGMISQSNSHLHITAQWLVPAIAYCVITLARSTTARTTLATGVGLGVLLAAQLLLGEEVLFLAVLSMAMFGLVYAACRWRWAVAVAPRFLGGVCVAGALSAALVAYPVWVQFQGPLHTPNAPFPPAYYYADVASYVEFSPLSIAGTPAAGTLATSSAEYNAFLGLPLLLVVLVLLIWRWRSPVTIAAGVTAGVMTLLSFGPTVTAKGVPTTWPSLYQHIEHAPIISGALPTRYSLALIPLIAVVLAYAVDAASREGAIARYAVPVAIIAALVPTLPSPLAVTGRQPVPTFISSGDWRQCAPDGGVIVPVPLPTPKNPDVMRWPAAANDAFAIPEGFFIGPYAEGGNSSIGGPIRPTSGLLASVAQTGAVPPITTDTQAQARADLSYWGADCIALAHVPNEAALHTTLDQLVGPGTLVADTWVWKINR